MPWIQVKLLTIIFRKFLSALMTLQDARHKEDLIQNKLEEDDSVLMIRTDFIMGTNNMVMKFNGLNTKVQNQLLLC